MQKERPQLIISKGDFNCHSSRWWAYDVEEPEGMALVELLETCNLH